MKSDEQKDVELFARESAQKLLAMTAQDEYGNDITNGEQKLSNMDLLLMGLIKSAQEGNATSATTVLTLGGALGKRTDKTTAQGAAERAKRLRTTRKAVSTTATSLRKALGVDGDTDNAKRKILDPLIRLVAQRFEIANRANEEALAADEFIHIEYSREGAERATANPILAIAHQATATALDGLNDLGLNERQQMKRQDTQDESEMQAFRDIMDSLNKDTDDDD